MLESLLIWNVTIQGVYNKLIHTDYICRSIIGVQLINQNVNWIHMYTPMEYAYFKSTYFAT